MHSTHVEVRFLAIGQSVAKEEFNAEYRGIRESHSRLSCTTFSLNISIFKSKHAFGGPKTFQFPSRRQGWSTRALSSVSDATFLVVGAGRAGKVDAGTRQRGTVA